MHALLYKVFFARTMIIKYKKFSVIISVHHVAAYFRLFDRAMLVMFSSINLPQQLVAIPSKNNLAERNTRSSIVIVCCLSYYIIQREQRS